jgi:hypothetical protein
MWTCRQCQEVLEETFDSCWKCGTSSSPNPRPAPEPEPAPEVEDPQPIPLTPAELKEINFSRSLLSIGGTLLLGGIGILRVAQSSNRLYYEALREGSNTSTQSLLAMIMIAAGAMMLIAGIARKFGQS